MRYAALMAALATTLLGPCTPGRDAAAPNLIATGNLNNLYVAVTARADGEEGFEFWQRDARGLWHPGGFGQGRPAAAAAWREDLLVFFPSGRIGHFGLAGPSIEASPVPSWTPVAACEDGLAADAFGWNAAGDPVCARFDGTSWTWQPVAGGLERGKVLDPCAVRFRGRFYLVWREEVPSLTGAAGGADYRLRFLYLEKERWHGPIDSRLRVASAPQVAGNGEALVCLFRMPAGEGGGPGPWTLAAYATADEDWHETGPLAGEVPEGPLVLARSGAGFVIVTVGPGGPRASALDPAAARVAEAAPVVLARRQAPGAKVDYSSAIFFAMMALATLLIVASWRRSMRASGAVPLPVPADAGAPRVYASIIRRAAAFAIDSVVVALALAPLVLYLTPDAPERMLRGEEVAWQDMVVLNLAARGLICLYTTIAEGAFGRTLGKAAMGLQVVTLAGGRISWRQAALRNVLRLVDELPSLYFVGLVLILTGPRPQRLGDRAAGTIVVVAAARARPVSGDGA